jgi:hypothetical protein
MRRSEELSDLVAQQASEIEEDGRPKTGLFGQELTAKPDRPIPGRRRWIPGQKPPETMRERPAWMSDRSLLPKRPPGAR